MKHSYVYFETTTSIIDSLKDTGLNANTYPRIAYQWGYRVLVFCNQKNAEEKAILLAEETKSDPLVLRIPLGLLLETQRLACFDTFMSLKPQDFLLRTDLEIYNHRLKYSYPKRPQERLSKLLGRENATYIPMWQRTLELAGTIAYKGEIPSEYFFEYVKVCLVEGYND